MAQKAATHCRSTHQSVETISPHNQGQPVTCFHQELVEDDREPGPPASQPPLLLPFGHGCPRQTGASLPEGEGAQEEKPRLSSQHLDDHRTVSLASRWVQTWGHLRCLMSLACNVASCPARQPTRVGGTEGLGLRVEKTQDASVQVLLPQGSPMSAECQLRRKTQNPPRMLQV
jgi:hypothetical protein